MRRAWRVRALPRIGVESLVREGVLAARGGSRYAEVPRLRPSIRVIAEGALDRSFTLGIR